MKQLIIILAFVTAIVTIVAFGFIDHIPPRSLTETRMHVLKRRILQYAQAHGELPHSLADVPEMRGYDSSFRDGWKHDIIFEVSPSGIVTFRSFGKDGRAGGSGEDADIIRSFHSRDTGGRWSDQLVAWSEDSVAR